MKTTFLGDENNVFVKQKDYKSFLGVPLRAEIQQNLSKILQIPVLLFSFYGDRFCLILF